MTCPACGGSDREPIAPSYWRCTSPVTSETTVIEPVQGAPPHLGMTRPVSYSQTRTCGTEYTEADGSRSSTTSPCFICDTLMIVHCRACGKPACGSHSTLVDDSRLCRDCAAAVFAERQREAQEEVAAHQAKAAAAEEALAKWCSETEDAFLRQMGALGNPGSMRMEARKRLHTNSPEVIPPVVVWRIGQNFSSGSSSRGAEPSGGGEPLPFYFGEDGHYYELAQYRKSHLFTRDTYRPCVNLPTEARRDRISDADLAKSLNTIGVRHGLEMPELPQSVRDLPRDPFFDPAGRYNI
jgi:hypothetical protein